MPSLNRLKCCILLNGTVFLDNSSDCCHTIVSKKFSPSFSLTPAGSEIATGFFGGNGLSKVKLFEDPCLTVI